MRKVLTASAVAALVLGTAFAAVSAPKPKPIDTSELREAVEVEDIRDHQEELQEIADENNGTRVSGTSGYDESADYVVKKLKRAGYKVTRQPFAFDFFQELSPPLFQRLSPDPREYGPDEFATMDYSGSGTVAAEIVATLDVVVPMPPDAPASTSNSGCEAGDFPASVANNIALIQRGTCFFQDKVANAQAAGAIGVIIFNEGQAILGRDGVVFGTLGVPTTIPVIGTSYAIGEELVTLAKSGPVTVQLTTDTISETRQTENIIADSKKGDKDSIVVVGAHLDSVATGPGINDNGSGTATILEIAIQIAEEKIKMRNKLRFAFWGAEESGLVGSQFYVDNLSDEELAKIQLNLNFDMLGSPNFVRFVYDGDGSDNPEFPGPSGSEEIEQVFLDYFARKRLATEPTAFDGRSDYGPFIAVGIPAGGLFSGAEGIKTAEQAAVYGGTAGEAYDPCYHQACDTFKNVSRRGLHQLADAAAHAVQVFAQKELAPPAISTLRVHTTTMDYRGSLLVR
jgi:Zn-dependent M28 family amino/carboxypeptidase